MGAMKKLHIILGYFVFLVMWLGVSPQIMLIEVPEPQAWLVRIFPVAALILFTLVAIAKLKE